MIGLVEESPRIIIHDRRPSPESAPSDAAHALDRFHAGRDRQAT
jgi:hypothetical protein